MPKFLPIATKVKWFKQQQHEWEREGQGRGKVIDINDLFEIIVCLCIDQYLLLHSYNIECLCQLKIFPSLPLSRLIFYPS